MNLQHLFFAFSLFIIQISFGVSQSYPETQTITGLPSQNQSIYTGWIVGDTPSGSLYYYNLYTKDATDLNSTDTPLIIYLKGRPGSPATMSAFMEVGPYLAILADESWQNFSVRPNPNSWTKDYHLLMIDNPLGTGFSILQNNYSINSTEQTVDNLITFLTRFFELYPSVVNMPIYLYGRSYGAKWASTLAYKWLQTEGLQEVPLAGLILAHGIVDPLLQLTYSESAFSFGVIDWKQKQVLEEQESRIAGFLKNNDLVNATKAWDWIRDYVQSPNVTGGMWVYNYVTYFDPAYGLPLEYLGIVYAYMLLSSPNFLYQTTFQIPEALNYSLASDLVSVPLLQTGDFANSTKYALEYVLDQGLDTLTFAGQFDPVINYVGIMNYVQALDWHGKEPLPESTKKFLTVNNSVAGSYHKQDNLVVAVVNKAGHYGTYDQPATIAVLLRCFIHDSL